MNDSTNANAIVQYGLKKRLLQSSVGVLLAFLALWAMCIFSMAVTGHPMSQAFPHKAVVLAVMVVLQAALSASVPIRREFQVWLRLSVITGFLLLGNGTVIGNLRTTQAVGAHFARLGWWITVLFGAGLWFRFAPVLRKQVPLDKHGSDARH